MWPVEVIFDQPIGQFAVENGGISVCVTVLDKFVAECPIEPLTHCIVLRRLRPAPPVLYVQLLHRCLKMFVEFAPVVRLDMHDMSVHQHVESTQEIRCVAKQKKLLCERE